MPAEYWTKECKHLLFANGIFKQWRFYPLQFMRTEYWTRECKHFPFANVIFKQWRFYSLQKYTGDASQHLGKMKRAKEIPQGKENLPRTWDPLCMVVLLHFLRLRPKEEHCCSGGGKNGDGQDRPHLYAPRKPLGSTCVSFPSLPLSGLTFSWAR